MWQILSEPLAQRVTWMLIHFVWQGAAIAAVLAILLRTSLAHTPQRRYAASVAALVMMVLGALLTCVVVDSVAINSNASSLSQSLTLLPQLHTASIQVSVSDRMALLQPYLLIAWTLGVLMLGGRLLFGYLGTLWLRRGRAALPLPVATRVEELRNSLGIVTARVYASSRVREALAVGFWRPIVLVPMAWITELPADVLEAVIAHELAHIRRWDRWVVLFQRLMETLLFYHPAVWWVSRTISFERELCCDELAVAATGRRLAYARALEAVGQQSAADFSLIFATSFQGEPDMKLLARVRNVLGMNPQREAGIAWPVGLLAVTIGLSLSLWSMSSVIAAGDEPVEKPKVAEKREKEEAKKSSPEAEAAKRKAVEAEKAALSKEEAVLRKLREAKLKAAELEKAKLTEEEILQRKLRESKERGAQLEKEAAEKAKSDYTATAKDYFKQKEAANKYGELRKEGTSALEGFKPQTDREAELFKLIQALHKEVAQLRQEVNQMREAPYVDKKKAPGKGETIKQPARESYAPKKAGTRDGEAIKKGPRDGETIKPEQRDGDPPKKVQYSDRF